MHSKSSWLRRLFPSRKARSKTSSLSLKSHLARKGKKCKNTDTDSTNETASKVKVLPQSTPLCRFCFEDVTEKEIQNGDVLSPCKCIGTSAFVHRTCLTRWQRRAQSSNPRGKAAYICSVCKSPYSLPPPPPSPVYTSALDHFLSRSEAPFSPFIFTSTSSTLAEEAQQSNMFWMLDDILRVKGVIRMSISEVILMVLCTHYLQLPWWTYLYTTLYAVCLFLVVRQLLYFQGKSFSCAFNCELIPLLLTRIDNEDTVEHAFETIFLPAFFNRLITYVICATRDISVILVGWQLTITLTMRGPAVRNLNAGVLLIASDTLDGTIFQRKCFLVTKYRPRDHSACGVIINGPRVLRSGRALEGNDENEIVCRWGGPVGRGRKYLYTRLPDCSTEQWSDCVQMIEENGGRSIAEHLCISNQLVDLTNRHEDLTNRHEEREREEEISSGVQIESFIGECTWLPLQLDEQIGHGLFYASASSIPFLRSEQRRNLWGRIANMFHN